MTPQSHSALLQWQRVELLVEQWLGERQQLLRLLDQLRLGCRAQPTPPLLDRQVQAFCQLLIDYISAGYFEVYRELAEQARHVRGGNPAAIARLLRQLDDSTDAALRFNDEFEGAPAGLPAISQLATGLGTLTDKLEERFALEDQLIVSIHQREVPAARPQLAVH